MKRLHELDLASALAFGIESTWRRILLFFLACWFSVFVAGVCDLAGWMRCDWWSWVGHITEHFIYAPWDWLSVVFFGFDGAGVLMFFVLGAALLMVLYMEMGYWHGVFVLLFTQPIHALWVKSSFSDWKRVLPSWLLLGVYLAGVVWVYVRCVRRSTENPR